MIAHDITQDPRRPLLKIEARQPQTGLVFLLHGSGDTAWSMRSLAEAWSRDLPHVKFVLPSAPHRSWYKTDPATGLLTGHEIAWHELLQMIESDRLLCGLQLSQVVFVGYSQGSMIAAWTALQLPQTCGGLVMLSGGAPWELQAGPSALQTRILYINGSIDTTVTPAATRDCHHRLQQLGFFNVDYRELPNVGHALGAEHVDLVRSFLREALPHGDADPQVLLNSSTQLHENVGSQEKIMPGEFWVISKGSIVIETNPEDHGNAAARGIVQGFDSEAEIYQVELEDGRNVSWSSEQFVQNLDVQLLKQSYFSTSEDPQGAETSAKIVGIEKAADGSVEMFHIKKVDHVQRRPAHQVLLPMGAVVRIGGLGHSTERNRRINGCSCHVASFLHAEGRYMLHIKGEEHPVRVRPRNVVP